MTKSIDELKVDIIKVISRLSDITLLESIRRDITAQYASVSENSSPWRGADTEIREGVTFDQLMKEQSYRKISFSDFTEGSTEQQWEVSLDTLLNNAN